MKNLKILFICLITFCSLSSEGQWSSITWPTSPNNGGDILETKIMGYDTIYTYIQGLGSRISYNRGQTWNSLPNNDIRYYQNYSRLYSIKLDSLFYSSDAGSTWNFKSIGHSKFSDYFFFNDSLLIRHSGVDTVIYKSSDYGVSWDTIMTPNYVHTTSLALNFEAQSSDIFKMVLVENVLPNNVKVNPFLVSTNNGGNTWDTIRIERGWKYNGQYSFDGYHTKIYSPNDSQVFYTGELELASLNIKTNTWDTSSFFNPSLGIYSVPNLLSVHNNTIVAACTLTGKVDSTIAISNDNGATWDWQNIVGANWHYEFIENLDLFDEYYGIASCSYGSIYLYDNRLLEPDFLGSDTIVCDEYAIDFSQYTYLDSIRWSDGDTSFAKNISDTGSIWATVYRGARTISDTITIGINTTSISIADTSFCFGGAVLADTGFTSYLWSTGATTDSAFINVSGIYSIEATDSNTCIARDTFSVTAHQILLDIPDTAKCEETITLYAGNYAKYMWSTGDTTDTDTFSANGNYWVSVTDVNGCQATDSFVLSSYIKPIIRIADSAQCTAPINIVADAFASYAWSNGNTTQTGTFNTSGTYNIVATDTNGCEARDTFEVTIFGNPTVSINDTTQCEGSIAVDAGSFASYTWSNGDVTRTSSFASTGTNSVTVTDTNGCSTTENFDVTIFTNPSIYITDYSQCGGTVRYTAGTFASYAWSNGSTSQVATYSTSDTNTVTVTDNNGCSATDTFILQIFDIPTISIADTTQCGGSVMVESPAFASYLWNTGGTAQTENFATSGRKSISVTDSNGCSASTTFNVTIFTNPTLTIQDTAQCGGDIAIQAPNFSSYAWNTGTTQSSETFSASGDYSLTVSDANGCEAEDSFSIEIYTLPTVDLLDTFLCPGESAVIDAGMFDSYAWSTGATSSSITTNVAGDYSVVVTDTNGCTASDTATIGGYPATVFTLGPDTALCADSIALNVATLKPLATSYTWSSGDTSDVVVFNQSGAYWLEVTDTNGCYGRDTINLTLNAAPIAPMISRVGDTLHTTSSLTHQWYKDGVAISGQADSTLPNITAGSYQVIVIDGNGCESDTSNLLIYTAGVSRLLADGMIRAYPNPSRGGVSLECNGIPQSKVNSIRLVSTLGQEIPIQTIWSGNTAKLTWDIAPQAVWLIVHTENGTFRTQIIER